MSSPIFAQIPVSRDLDRVSMDTTSNQNELDFPSNIDSTIKPSLITPPPGIIYGSKDSNIIDLVHQKIYLYGEAYIKYEDFEIKSDYIVFDLGNNEVEAYSPPEVTSRPSFKTGDQNVIADRIRYNIDTEKGIVHGARVGMNQLYIHGAVTKFVKAGSDSLHIDDVIYNRNALITTCDKDHPHWGIRTSKLKLIPDKIAIIGPANMELGGIPIPFILPFAFAPLFDFNQGTSGLIFPQDPFYTSPDLGIGIRGLGYYFALSDYMDLSVKGDIYSRGSWALNTSSNYKKRYKFNGAVNLSFSKQLRETEGNLFPSIQNSYSISINHNQDGRAHPYRTLGGSLRFTVNDFDRRNYAEPEAQLNSQINSNFAYGYRLNDKLNFSTAINHSQNTLNRSISFTLPQMQLRMSRVFPFKKENSSSNDEAWFEKINVQYDGKFQNSVSTVDTLLFTKETLESFRSGFSHSMNIGANYNVLEYFSLSTNIDYDEFWYLQTRELTGIDSNGITISEINGGFTPLRDLRLSTNLNTNIFGTLQFAKGWLRGIRHTMRPSIGMSYAPSSEGYYKYFNIDPTNPGSEKIQYNPFSSSNGANVFSNRFLDQGGMLLTYSIANTLEGKYYSRKDSMEKKFNLLNSLSVSGNYNLTADSLKWSTVSMSASTNIFQNLSALNINASFDPYIKDGFNRLNKTEWSVNKRLLRLENISASISTSFSLKELRDFFSGRSKDEGQANNSRNTSPNAKQSVFNYPELFSWFEEFRFNHIFQMRFYDDNGTKKFETSVHSVQVTTGNIPLSDNWAMRIGNLSYDFKEGRFVYPSFTISRNLHCWDLNISWQPQADTYSFYIGVKASPFSEFIKYRTGRTAFDNQFSFR